MRVFPSSIDDCVSDHRVARNVSRQRRRYGAHALLVAAAVTQVGASGSAAHAQTLDESLNWTLRTSVSIRADDARQEGAVARLHGSIDAFLPQVVFVQEKILGSKISYAPDISVPTTQGLDSTIRREPDLYSFQAVLPLFDGLKRYNNFRSASIGVEAGKLLQIDKRQQVLLDAATAYLSIIRDRKIVELRRRQVTDIASIAQKTEGRFSTRDATQSDLDIAGSRVLASKVALEQSMADLESSKIEFTRLTGAEPHKLAPPRIPNDLVPTSIAELKSSLLQSSPRIRAARLDAIGAGYAALSQMSDVMPQVNLVAVHYKQSNISQALYSATDSTVKVQLRVPLYEPGAFPRLGEARALARQKSWEAADNEKQSLAQASSLLVGRNSLISQIGQSTARVRTMQKAVEGYQIEQSNGLRVIIDSLNTRNELTEAQVAQANLEFLRDKQTFTLAAALARLGPSTTQLSQLADESRASITR